MTTISGIEKTSITLTKMTRTMDDIYTYEKQALDLIEARYKDNRDHPNYSKLRDLLIDQINDELYDVAHTTADRRTSRT